MSSYSILPVTEKPSTNRTLLSGLSWIIWLILAAIVVFMTTHKIAEFDIWYHLGAGKYFIEHKTVPTHDVFSFTAYGQPWVAHEWLYQIILFLVYQLGASYSLIIFTALIVLASFFFIFLALRQLKINILISIPLIILASFAVTFHAHTRPHVITNCLLTLYLLILLSYKYNSTFRNRGNLLWLLLLVQFFWANMHSGMILGFGLFALFGIMELLHYSLAQRFRWLSHTSLLPKESFFILKVAGAMFLVSFLNPNLHKALLYPFIVISKPDFMERIGELRTPLLHVFRHSDYFVAFLLLLGIGMVSFILNRKHLELTNLAIFLIGTTTGIRTVRNLPIFSLLAVPIIAINLQNVFNRRLLTRISKQIYTICYLILLLVSAGILLMVFLRGINLTNYYRNIKPSLGYEKYLVPVNATDFITKSQIKGNILCTPEFGSYFIWQLYPKHLVFMDSRLEVYGTDMFKQYGRMLWSLAVFDSVVQQYNIDCCVLPQPIANTSITQYYIGRTLGLRNDWTLVYWDDVALIYLRNTQTNQKLIDQYAFRAIVPILLSLPTETRDYPQMLNEALRATTQNPSSPLAYTTLGSVYMELGQLNDAQIAFKQALALDHQYTDALLGLGIVYFRLDNPVAGIVTLERLVDLDASNSMAFYNLGYAYYRNKDYKKAESTLKKSIKLDSQMVPAYLLLGDIFLQSQRYKEARLQWQAILKIAPDNQSARNRLDKLPNSNYP